MSWTFLLALSRVTEMVNAAPTPCLFTSLYDVVWCASSCTQGWGAEYFSYSQLTTELWHCRATTERRQECGKKSKWKSRRGRKISKMTKSGRWVAGAVRPQRGRQPWCYWDLSPARRKLKLESQRCRKKDFTQHYTRHWKMKGAKETSANVCVLTSNPTWWMGWSLVSPDLACF